MLTTIKKWLSGLRKSLCDRILPTYIKDTIVKENTALKAKCAKLEQEIAERDAYIAGLEFATRYRNRVSIRNIYKDDGGQAT